MGIPFSFLSFSLPSGSHLIIPHWLFIFVFRLQKLFIPSSLPPLLNPLCRFDIPFFVINFIHLVLSLFMHTTSTLASLSAVVGVVASLSFFQSSKHIHFVLLLIFKYSMIPFPGVFLRLSILPFLHFYLTSHRPLISLPIWRHNILISRLSFLPHIFISTYQTYIFDQVFISLPPPFLLLHAGTSFGISCLCYVFSSLVFLLFFLN